MRVAKVVLLSALLRAVTNKLLVFESSQIAAAVRAFESEGPPRALSGPQGEIFKTTVRVIPVICTDRGARLGVKIGRQVWKITRNKVVPCRKFKIYKVADKRDLDSDLSGCRGVPMHYGRQTRKKGELHFVSTIKHGKSKLVLLGLTFNRGRHPYFLRNMKMVPYRPLMGKLQVLCRA